MNCCLNSLGNFPHNEDLDTGLTAGQVGTYKAVLFFAGVRIKRSFQPTTYGNIVIPRPFNENYKYKMQIEQPDGNLYEDNDGCSIFEFSVYQSLEPPCGDECQ